MQNAKFFNRTLHTAYRTPGYYYGFKILSTI
jgi:hypothetical protein